MKRPLRQLYARAACSDRAGFTLVELLVAMGLMVIMITILAQIMAAAQAIYDIASRRTVVYANGRAALDIIADDLSHVVSMRYRDELGLVSTELDFRARSLPLPDDYATTTPSTEFDNFVDVSAAPLLPALQADVEDRYVLAFFGNVRYYDPATSRHRFDMVRIVYYMRKRANDPVTTLDRPGAHLIRRIEPYYIDNSVVPSTFNWGIPGDPAYRVEDDVCSFVRGVTVYYLDRGVDPSIPGVPDAAFRQCFGTADPPPLGPAPAGPWVADASPAFGHVLFRMQDDPFGLLNGTTPFDSSHFLPPALLIVLTVSDDSGIVFRDFRRVINLDTSPTSLPLKPFQW